MHLLIKLLAITTVISGCRTRSESDLKKGGKDGNSGDVVACHWDIPTQRTILFLDYYETLNDPQSPSPIVPLNPQELAQAKIYPQNYKNMAQALINRLKLVDPYRFELYSDFIAHFDDESYIGLDLNMPDLPDRGPSFVTIPKGCSVELAAYQQTPQKVTNQRLSSQVRALIEKRYIIEKKYWDALDDFNKGILIAHEVFYREARAYGFRQSKLIRLFSSFLLRNTYSQVSQRQEFAETIVNDYHLPAIIPAKEINAAYQTIGLETYPNGSIASGVVARIPDLRALENDDESTKPWFTKISVADKVYAVTEGIKLFYTETKNIVAIHDLRDFQDYLHTMAANEVLFGGTSVLGIEGELRQYVIGSCTFSFSPGYDSRIEKIEFTSAGAVTTISFNEAGASVPMKLCEQDQTVVRSFDVKNGTTTLKLIKI